MNSVPFAKPFVGGGEADAARKVILSGWVTQGPRVEEFEDNFASYVGAKYACAVSSCTTALHLALIAVGVKPGDVVVTVSHSFIATANSIRHCQAEPVFVDIDLNTFNISSECLTKFLKEDCLMRNGQLYYNKISRIASGESPLNYLLKTVKYQKRLGRVACILPVHQMGMPCDLGAILSVARKFNLPVVEDAACALGSEILISGNKKWDKIGKPHADIACFSFHPRKLITTGEGGMITTGNPRFDKKLRLLRHHGMNISDAARHSVKKITFEDYVLTGYNYRMSDILAAIGIVQLKKLPEMVAERRKVADIYQEELKGISWLILPQEPACSKSNWQSYPLRLSDSSPMSRNKLMQYLLNAGISTRKGIMNAHQEIAYKLSRWRLPASEKASSCSLLLPIFNSISLSDIKRLTNILRRLKR